VLFAFHIGEETLRPDALWDRPVCSFDLYLALIFHR
jgi:hypothetical protein